MEKSKKLYESWRAFIRIQEAIYNSHDSWNRFTAQFSCNCILIKLMRAFLEIGFVEMDIAIGIRSLKRIFCEYDFLII